MTNEHEPMDRDEARIDSIARAAGAALRQPAPADGIARVQTSHRRRQTLRAAASGSIVAAVALAAFVVANRSSDDGRVVVTPPTTAPEPTPTVEPTTPTTLTTEPTPITEPTPTTEPIPTDTTGSPSAGAGWEAPAEAFPPLSYVACCGTDWVGDPSPAVPVDPAAPLSSGIYNVRPLTDADGNRDTSHGRYVDGLMALEIRPYVRCSDLPEQRCSEEGPYADTDLGVDNEPARSIDLELDASVRVAITGFACDSPDQLRNDPQTGTGADLLALMQELDEAYEAAVATPLRGGADPVELGNEIAANSPVGFFDPGCPSYTNFAWAPQDGPAVMTFLDLFPVADGLPGPTPAESASERFILPTALAVDELGNLTVYLFAGFTS